MRLAIIDQYDTVLIAWPTTAEAHADIADKLAAELHPGRFRQGARTRTALALRNQLIELQRETRRL